MTQDRVASLDGLRGSAALVVLVHHSFLLAPVLARPYYFPAPSGEGVRAWLMIYSPLHLVWAGTEAVFLFFVISGVALTLATASPRFSWSSYFPSRMVRLYGPIVVAVIFAAITIFLVPRTGGVQGLWLAGRPEHYSLGAMAKDMVLLEGVSYTVSPLWSLQWEVLFSLLLAVFLAFIFARWMWVNIAVAILLSTAGLYLGLLPLIFLPMFVIGVALAKGWGKLETLSQRISGARGGILYWILLTVVGALLTCSYWLVLPIYSGSMVTILTRPLILIGVTIIVFVAVFWAPFAALFSGKFFQWAGRICFSLYLVHEPIVIAFGFRLNESLWAIPLAIVVSIIVAVGFYFAVERPVHRLSRRLRNAIAAREARDASDTTTAEV